MKSPSFAKIYFTTAIGVIIVVLLTFVIHQFIYGSKETTLYNYKEAKRIMDTTKEMDVYLFAEEALSDKFLTIQEYSDLISLRRDESNKKELDKFKETL